jgi:plasmid maintenance system antidote protein VapI
MLVDFWLGLQLDWDLWHAMHSPDATRIETLEPISVTTPTAPSS